LHAEAERDILLNREDSFRLGVLFGGRQKNRQTLGGKSGSSCKETG
jgi:hypothetical protein